MRVTTYLIYELHPSYVVIPLYILIYRVLLISIYIGWFRKFSVSTISALCKNNVIFPSLRTTGDCHIHLPATYLVLSSIMLLPNVILLLKNWHKIYAMNLLMLEYSIMDSFFYVSLVLLILLLKNIAEPRQTVITDGMLLYKKYQSTKLGCFARHVVRLLLLLCASILAFSATPFAVPCNFTSSLDLSSAFAHIHDDT